MTLLLLSSALKLLMKEVLIPKTASGPDDDNDIKNENEEKKNCNNQNNLEHRELSFY